MRKTLTRAIPAIIFSLAMSATLGSSLAFATTIGTNVSVGGNLTVTGTSTLTGALAAPGGITGNLTSTAQNALQLNPFGVGVGNTGESRYLELAANGANYVGFKAGDSLLGNVIWTLPLADGAVGQFLSTDGAGILSWSTETDPVYSANAFATGMDQAVATGSSPTFVNVTSNLTGNASTATTAGSATTAGTVTTAAQPAITSLGTLTGLAFADGALLNLSAINGSSTTEGLKLPQDAATACASSTAEGQICWDSTGNVLYVGDSAAASPIGNPFGASIDSSEITNDTIVNADINTAAAIGYSKLNLASSIVNGDLAAGTFSNITGVGALGAGSIASGFGSIDTGNDTISTTGLVTTGALTAGGHVKSTAPATTDKGVGFTTCSSVTVTGTDTRGTITATCTIGQAVVVTFGSPYVSAPVCVISPANTEANTGNATLASTTTEMTLTSIAAATAGTWKYICIE